MTALIAPLQVAGAIGIRRKEEGDFASCKVSQCKGTWTKLGRLCIKTAPTL